MQYGLFNVKLLKQSPGVFTGAKAIKQSNQIVVDFSTFSMVEKDASQNIVCIHLIFPNVLPLHAIIKSDWIE